GLVGADVVAQDVSAERLAGEKSSDVVYLDGDKKINEIRVGVFAVRQKPDVAAHPSKVNEADKRQGQRLKLTLDTVAQDRNCQDTRDHDEWKNHEKVVRAGLRPVLG